MRRTKEPRLIYIGIDPGISGAIALLTPQKELIETHFMPIMKLGKANRVNAADLARILRMAGRGYAIVERVSAMPGQGVVSMFSFGHAAGVAEAVLATLGIPYELVTPQRWKRHFGLIGLEKDASRAKAIQLYPKASLSRKKDVGIADAILLARYGVETCEGYTGY